MMITGFTRGVPPGPSRQRQTGVSKGATATMSGGGSGVDPIRRTYQYHYRQVFRSARTPLHAPKTKPRCVRFEFKCQSDVNSWLGPNPPKPLPNQTEGN
ncbi:hypothetical protein Ancab_027902 [Ancistrocladus abbreviatus]